MGRFGIRGFFELGQREFLGNFGRKFEIIR
jgi:hypothetical protein